MSKIFKVLSFTIILLFVSTFQSYSKENVIIGSATYYHSYYENKIMANGQPYRGSRLTTASMVHRLGSRIKVTNLKNGKSIIVTVTDRGNFSHRNVDLSLRAFESIARRSSGRIKVKIEVIGFEKQKSNKRK